MCWGWTHGGEVSQQLISCLDCITEGIRGRTDVTLAGGDSRGSVGTGYTRRTSCGEIHGREISYQLLSRLDCIAERILGRTDVTLAGVDIRGSRSGG